MEELNLHQINKVVEWLNECEELKDTRIPLNFKEDFLKRSIKEYEGKYPWAVIQKHVNDE